MGLFSNTPLGGGLADSIRCDEQDYLIWKWHPKGTTSGENRKENSIRWGSSLRVKEGSAAVFVYSTEEGIAQDYIIGPYDGILKTDNLPIISNIIGLMYEGNTPFPAEVYFVNLAKIIQMRFGVPYFDVFDPRFLDFGVPTAVRGTINFHITDVGEFVKLHRLDNFGLDDFKKQVQSAVIRYVKSIVSNSPEENDIPVLQLEKKIDDINEITGERVKKRLYKEYGVTVSSIDVTDIEFDKDSNGYKQLKKVTTDITSKNIKAEQKINVFQKAANAFVDIKEEQFARHKKINESSSFGKILTNKVSDVLNKNKQGNGITPPPIPTEASYFVASNGKPTGPFDMHTLLKMKNKGTLSENSLVWKEGMSEWQKAITVEELKSLFPAMPPIPNQE